MPQDEDATVWQLGHGARLARRAVRAEFSRGGGPGGQNVNKVNSRVTLRVALAAVEGPEPVLARLHERLAGRLTREGEIVVAAGEFRDQKRNREAAEERLRALLEGALRVAKKRRPTKPTRGSVERRIAARKRRSDVKRERRWRPE